MDGSRLAVLQAAEQILDGKRPDGRCIDVLTAYADTNLPGTETVPLDELATLVALKLMDIKGDPTRKNS